MGEMAARVVRVVQDLTDILPVDPLSREQVEQDVQTLLIYLDAACQSEADGLFLDYLSWARWTQDKGGLDPDALARTLKILLEPEAGLNERAVAMVRQGLAGLDHPSALARSVIDPLHPQADLARDYLDRMLSHDRNGAMGLILDAHDRGTPVRDLYLGVFQPVLREVGRLWQINQVSVAQEHFISAATQLIMSRLYPSIFSTPRKGRRLVAACVSGELHEIGIRMVADLFEMEGWSTLYLGASVPVGDLAILLRREKPDLLAVSATLSCHVPQVAAMIRAVRDAALPVKILVGGHPFNLDPDLWRRLGADGCARDGALAVAVGDDLVGRP